VSGGELVILAPLEGEISDLLRRLGPGEPVAAPAPARIARYRRGEATVLAGWTGMGAAATERALDALLARRPAAVLHMGVAGALRRELGPGEAVLITAAARGGERLECPPAPALAARLLAAGAREGESVTVDAAVGDPARKCALALRHPTALVVEMETWWAARSASAAGVAFAGVRVVVDGLDQTLPDLSSALDEVGNPRPLRLAATLLRRPGTVRHLPALGRAFAQARARLTALGLAAIG
jgi:nucleoside phosphorylase